jgi:hypothetical protein
MSAAVEAIATGTDPDPSWPMWDVELAGRFGGLHGDSCLMAAPTAADAAAWVNEAVAGTGSRATGIVEPARLHPNHPRFAATEAVRRSTTTTPELEEVT